MNTNPSRRVAPAAPAAHLKNRHCGNCKHVDTCNTARTGADCGADRPAWEPANVQVVAVATGEH